MTCKIFILAREIRFNLFIQSLHGVPSPQMQRPCKASEQMRKHSCDTALALILFYFIITIVTYDGGKSINGISNSSKLCLI